VAVLNDSKYGWDKPADNVLRLTLLHSPKPGAWPRPFYQSAQDIGSHRFVYSLAGHAGDWRAGRIPERAARLNQKLVAFQTTKHAGVQGPSFSLAALTDTEGQIAVRALKRAEDSDEIVIRVQELYGRTARTRIKLSGGIGAAREINAAEEPIGPFAPSGSELDVSLGPYQPRTFAVRMALASGPAAPAVATSVPLPFNLDGISLDAARADGNLDGKGLTIAGEQWPTELTVNGVRFALGSNRAGAANILIPAGERLPLPAGSPNRVYVLAAAVGGDVPATFSFGTSAGAGRTASVTVRDGRRRSGSGTARSRRNGCCAK
jgi:alpha-mannosidase